MIRLLLLFLLVPAVSSAGLVTASWAPVGNQAGASFGAAIAPAGDVNRDGYADVLVGAPKFDNGQADEGRVYLYMGSVNGLASIPAWTWEPNQGGAQAGSVVAPAGDVNNDGFDDILVGAPMFDRPGHVDAGAVFVFYGSATVPPSSPSVTLFNDVTGARFGASAAAAGDVNGDFVPDIVVGAPAFANGQANEGAVYVFHGSNGALATVASFTLEGNEVDARLGAAVTGAGDVNGDAYADVLLGAPGSSPNAVPAAGKALLYRGSGAGIGATGPITIAGTADSAQVGAGVSLAGDVTSDGYADVLIGSPGDHAGGVRRGSWGLYLGDASGISSGPSFQAVGPVDQARIGAVLATAGDLDGDGYADAVAGNERGNQVVVYYGRLGGLFNPTPLTGTQALARFGAAAATAGDFDGDGLAELLVGAPDYGEPGLLLEGAARAFLGRPGGPVQAANSPLGGSAPATSFGDALAIVPNAESHPFPSLLIGEPDWPGGGRVLAHRGQLAGIALAPAHTFDASADDQAFGSEIADVGDVNRDTQSDFVIGSPFYSAGGLSDRGRAVLYRGGDSGGPVLDSWLAIGDQANATFGHQVAGRGDVNGDGYADFVVSGDNWSDGANTACGKAWLYIGSPSGPSSFPVWSAQGTAQNQFFGYRLAMLDFDADGYSDVAVLSQPSFPNPSPARVDIYYGSPAGLSAQPAFTLSPTPPRQEFGSAMAGVGDYDGDGVGDLVVSAIDGAGGAGELFLYPGSLARSNPSGQVRMFTGNNGAVATGFSLAGGGDLNGDGRADFVAGAPFSSNGESGEGRLIVFYGKGGFGPLVPDTTLESNVQDSGMGRRLAPLADLNGDSYADIASGGDERVWVYFGGGEGPYQGVVMTEPLTAGVTRNAPALLNSQDKLGTAMQVRSAAGRTRVRLQYEIRRQHEPFTGVSNFTEATGGSSFDTGAPSPFGSLLSFGIWVEPLWPNVTYHWRGRSATWSPYFPRSRWYSPEGRLDGQYDFRTAFVPLATPGVVVTAPRLGRITPNPAFGPVSIAFTLPGGAPLKLDVYDVRGRHVRTLARESSDSGTRTWDGADASGRRVPPGLYFVELRSGATVDRARVVRLE